MLSEKETAFIAYWEANRENEKTVSYRIIKGLPMAMLFALPILLFVVVVKLYFPDWNAKVSQTSPGMLLTAVVAVMITVLFYSYFRMQFKWEHNEEIYCGRLGHSVEQVREWQVGGIV